MKALRVRWTKISALKLAMPKLDRIPIQTQHDAPLCLLPTVREGNVFRSICHSVHRGVERTPLPWGRPRDSGIYLVAATAVVRTHPTGMHSCSTCYLFFVQWRWKDFLQFLYFVVIGECSCLKVGILLLQCGDSFLFKKHQDTRCLKIDL